MRSTGIDTNYWNVKSLVAVLFIIAGLRSQVYICSTLPMQINLVCTVAYHSHPIDCSVYLPIEIWPSCPEFILFIEAEELHDARPGNTSKTQWPNKMYSPKRSQRYAVSALITSQATHTHKHTHTLRMGVVCCVKGKLWKVICGASDSSLYSNDTLFFNTDRFVLIVIFPVQPLRFLCHLEVR